MPAFSTALQASRTELVRLARGSEDGKQTWYYIRVEKSKLSIYLNKMKRGETINVYNFGEVLYYGWGEEPPKDITQKVYDECA